MCDVSVAALRGGVTTSSRGVQFHVFVIHCNFLHLGDLHVFARVRFGKLIRNLPAKDHIHEYGVGIEQIPRIRSKLIIIRNYSEQRMG